MKKKQGNMKNIENNDFTFGKQDANITSVEIVMASFTVWGRFIRCDTKW